jgi:HEPN domain-containing protein
MITDELAGEYIFRAKRRLEEAHLGMEKHDYPIVVRNSQESLELAIKGLLRLYAIEYPKEHDVSRVIDYVVDKIPAKLRTQLKSSKQLMTELAKKRGIALYGLEREGIPARKLFDREYAEKILERVQNIVLLCDGVYTKFRKKKKSHLRSDG